MGIEKKKRIGIALQTHFSSLGLKWFLCFGTLLSVIRDKCFDISQDIDIGVIGPIDDIFQQQYDQGNVNNFIKSNHTGKILKFDYRTPEGVHIDVFRWVKFKGMYWHTLDYKMEFPKNGVPSEYLFKSMPKEVFDIDQKEIMAKIEDTKYYNQGRSTMTKHGTWYKSLPEAPTEGIDFTLPYMYGYFLDIAYPDWATERKQFGQSKGYTEIKVKGCKGLC